MDRKITDTEEVARQILETNWENVLRATPRKIEEFSNEFPKICEEVYRRVKEQGLEGLSNIFRPGVPDFLAFNDDGDYLFVEVKGEGDGLRHSQLKWFRDFSGINCEIWFTDSNEGVTEKMDSNSLEAYSLRDPVTDEENGAEVIESERKGFNAVQIPETLAAMMDLENGDNIQWEVEDRSMLRLDTD